MALTLNFPDIEELLTAHLTSVMGVPAGTRASTAPTFLRVRRTGGPAATRVTDSPQVTVEAYAPLESNAAALLADARRVIADLVGVSLAGWLVKSVTELGGPANLPDPNNSSHRYTLTAVVQIRGK